VSSPDIINIAGYKFVALQDLKRRRLDLRGLCQSLGLKGTILLSREGINLFLAGTRQTIDHFLEVLRNEPQFEDLQVKESVSDRQPFTRMLVRLKQEIIAFGVEEIDPAAHPSRRISPQQLKEWLDTGKPVTLLDTRNDYEIELGTFNHARAVGIEDFRQFPNAVARLPQNLKDQPIVTFCTGGIRCEKAAPYLEKAGFTDVYQLEGGILKYFEEVGGVHYHGDCFVFDQRVALDSSLRESAAQQCYRCQAILTPNDCHSPQYIAGQSCPHCYQTATEKMAATLRKRQAAITATTSPLPGSLPYENRRPIRVSETQHGQSVIQILENLKNVRCREEWLKVCQTGRVRIQGASANAERRLAAGECLELITPGMIEPSVNANITILYEDNALVAVNKPAPLPMHAAGRFNRNTLHYILLLAFHPWKLRSAHRLDANTSGALLFSKTRRHAAQVQLQFENGQVLKRYHARVQGQPPSDTFQSDAPISRSPAAAGGRLIDPHGLPALTEFRVLKRFSDNTTLLEATPRTGRTNQIRVHLWNLGTPICGDPLYLPGKMLGERQTLLPSDPPMCLHSSLLQLRHPISQAEISFQAPPPAWAEA